MLEVVFERTFSSFGTDEFVHLLTVPVFFRVPTGVEHLVPKLLLPGGDIFSNESVLRSLDVSESLAVTSELFLDFDSDALLFELFKLLPSLLLFLQDCAEWGLPGESPLRLRVPGAGLCLPRESPQLKIYTLSSFQCEAKNMWMCYTEGESKISRLLIIIILKAGLEKSNCKEVFSFGNVRYYLAIAPATSIRYTILLTKMDIIQIIIKKRLHRSRWRPINSIYRISATNPSLLHIISLYRVTQRNSPITFRENISR